MESYTAGECRHWPSNQRLLAITGMRPTTCDGYCSHRSLIITNKTGTRRESVRLPAARSSANREHHHGIQNSDTNTRTRSPAYNNDFFVWKHASKP
jgi:hypothetical protein